MNKSTPKTFLFILLMLSLLMPISVFSQQESAADTSLNKIDNYQEQIKRLMGFLEFSLNTLGGSEASTREKEIIINESYLKAFLNEKVQVEDDLDENREILTYKDVQAYLKDVDFFFKEAVFTIDVQDVQSLTNDQGMTYFKVTANRNLQATTVDDLAINNNKTRYIEINLDEEEQVLKIASIYTTRLNEAQELMSWWNRMPSGWKDFLGSQYMLTEALSLSQIDFLNDTTFLLIHEVPAIVEFESFVYIGTDSLLVTNSDTVMKEVYDTIPAGKNNGLRMLKEITKQESLDVSSNLQILDLYPVDQMTDLRSLNISNTLISDLFPARNLTRLASLNISGTAISDLSPIRYNTRIRELYLDSTLVTSLSPIRNFTELEILFLRNTLIDSLDYLRNIGNLKELRLDNTPVSDLTALSDLVSLESLSMSGTNADSLSSLQYLITLKRINFERTGIKDLGPLSRLDSLQIIDADQTQISDLEPLAGISSLERVYCDQTQITRSLANAFMTAHPGALIIYESQELSSWWSGLNPDWQNIFRGYATLDPVPTTEQLHQLTMLSLVDITGNKNITDIRPLSSITNLKEVRAGGTLVSDISPLKELSDLKILSCPDTRISDLRPLQALLNLEKLDISGTLADTLDGLNSLTHLQVLQIDRTKVGDLRPVTGCRSLRFIYCDNTKVGKVDIDSFLDSNPECLIIYQTSLLKSWWGSLPATWKTAFRAHTQIDEPPTREQLHTLAGLQSIDVAGNRDISSLEPLTTLHRLEEFSIANGTLQDISPLQTLVRLKKLNLSGNPVSDLTPLSHLPDLSDLDISNTAISKLDAVKTIESLERLNCSGTQIKKLDPVAYLGSLRKLECFNTGINNLKPLTELTQLRHLVCYNTKLAAKKVEAFKVEKPEVEVVFY
jgi:Leucine-rich repeat (LRR) protein